MSRAASKKHYDANKAYYRERNRNARLRKAAYVARLREQPCADCRRSFPSCVMEFDHRGDKVRPIARALTMSWKQLKEEIAKCDLVCANCHAIRTHARRASTPTAEGQR